MVSYYSGKIRRPIAHEFGELALTDRVSVPGGFYWYSESFARQLNHDDAVGVHTN